MKLLKDKASILHEYFCIHIDNEMLLSIPILMNGYQPRLEILPLFLYDLCMESIWDDEINCFRSISLIIANFYSKLPTEYPISDVLNNSNSLNPILDTNNKSHNTSINTNTNTNTTNSITKNDSNNSNDNSNMIKRKSILFPQLTKDGIDLLSNILYPAMRIYLTPHKQRNNDQTIIQIAALEQLYKIFERC